MGLENFCLNLETFLPYMGHQVSFLEMRNRVKWTQQIDLLSNVWVLHSSADRALQGERRGHGFEYPWSLLFLGGLGGEGLSCNPLKLYAITTATIMSSFNNFIFPQFTLSLFHVSFISWVKMNSTNSPALNISVFAAQLVGDCSANAKANGSDTTQMLSVSLDDVLCFWGRYTAESCNMNAAHLCDLN